MKKKAYLVGIKGVAMTAMALYLKEKGYEVSGSDVEEVFLTDEVLHRHGIHIHPGFSPKHIDPSTTVVIVTGAHGGMTNPEAVQAKTMGIPTYMHGAFLGKCMEGKTAISIAGCHGKTTTSALVAALLLKGGYDPSYAVGAAEIPQIGEAGHAGTGTYFIAEADEYVTCPQTDPTPRFLWQHPSIAVITNIDFDHPDVYPSLDEVKEAYRKFIYNVTAEGTVVACFDDATVRSLVPGLHESIISYGTTEDCNYRITNITYTEGKSIVSFAQGDTELGAFTIRIPGKHNAVNALGGAIAAHLAGVSWEDIRNIIPAYHGAKRRFEKIASHNNILFYDDYAHHPEEIMATLAAARAWFPTRRLVVLFQPHTYSRTKRLLHEFGSSFQEADIALVTEIFPSARETYDPTLSSRQIVAAGKKHKDNLMYVADKDEAIKTLAGMLSPNDIFITLGAGDIYRWQADIISSIRGSYGTIG